MICHLSVLKHAMHIAARLRILVHLSDTATMNEIQHLHMMNDIFTENALFLNMSRISSKKKRVLFIPHFWNEYLKGLHTLSVKQNEFNMLIVIKK
jgi:hypothetical protein